MARERAARRGLATRVTFEQADAVGWTGDRVDAVLCVGATHAFCGLGPTLDAVGRRGRRARIRARGTGI